MEKFFEKIGNVLAQKDYEYVRNTYNLMKDKYKGNDLESQRFAVKIAEAILDNRLDYKSIVVGLMYPIFRIEPSIVDL